jgi:hypothetical protein
MKYKNILTFPALPKGYGWNLRQKIQLKLGLKDGQVHLNTNPNGSELLFEVDLTEAQKAAAKEIMADPESAQEAPPELIIPGNNFVIKDLYYYKAQLEADTGYQLQVYYESSGNFGTIYDEIFVIPCDSTYTKQRKLTGDELKRFFTAYRKLVRVQ